MLIVWGPVNVLPAEPVCALYAVTNALKSSTLIWFVVPCSPPPITIGNTLPPATCEPETLLTKGNSDIFLVAILKYIYTRWYSTPINIKKMK